MLTIAHYLRPTSPDMGGVAHRAMSALDNRRCVLDHGACSTAMTGKVSES